MSELMAPTLILTQFIGLGIGFILKKDFMIPITFIACAAEIYFLWGKP